jgi:hypothetical protein
MSIDAYSPCPGGTGKKIKFCCGDFLTELQKIDRMIEGEQYLACLQHIDQLLSQRANQERACLLASKVMLLRTTGERKAAEEAAAAFLAKHPNNQIALAETAMLAAAINPKVGLELVMRALRVAAGDLAARTYQAMGLVAGYLLRAGFTLPARALFELQCEIAEEDDRAEDLLETLIRATDVPLLVRDEPPLLPCPKDAPWSGRFDEAMQPIQTGDWVTAAERLAALAGEVPDSPVLWSNLAVLRGRLADNAGCIEAWRRYAAIRGREEDGLEDAVEAEARAMFLSADPLGDRIDIVNLVWTVKDAERAQERLLSSPRLKSISFDPAHFSDGETPPPKGAFMLLDRSIPESAEGLNVETMPCVLGHAMLFGRQTDCEARLEVVNVAADELAVVIETVREAVGDSIDGDPKQEAIAHWSASHKLLRPAWQPPSDISSDQLRSLMTEYARRAILERWPSLKLGVLDGRSPGEEADELRQVSSPAHGDLPRRTRLLAAVLVFENGAENMPGDVDFNELRAKLGLPTLEPIDPAKTPVGKVPVTRLSRVTIEGLSDSDLISAYYRTAAFSVRDASRKFAAAIIERPSLAGSNERIQAYTTLVRTEEDASQALKHLDAGRRATDEKKTSHAMWDMMELSFHFGHQNAPAAMRMLEHIQRRHISEPGVAEALTRMLVGVGLLNPDGTPAYFGPDAGEPAMAADAPAEPGGLWTPDSATPAGGGGKLWTPDS